MSKENEKSYVELLLGKPKKEPKFHSIKQLRNKKMALIWQNKKGIQNEHILRYIDYTIRTLKESL